MILGTLSVHSPVKGAIASPLLKRYNGMFVTAWRIYTSLESRLQNCHWTSRHVGDAPVTPQGRGRRSVESVHVTVGHSPRMPRGGGLYLYLVRPPARQPAQAARRQRHCHSWKTVTSVDCSCIDQDITGAVRILDPKGLPIHYHHGKQPTSEPNVPFLLLISLTPPADSVSILAGTASMPPSKQATLQVSLSASPTLSLGDETATLDVSLNLRVTQSTRPDTSVTILAFRNVFEVSEDGLDMFAYGAFTPLKSVDDPDSRKIFLGGHLRVNEVMASDALDLRDRGLTFLTIPPDGIITITHRLDWARIFKYADRGSVAGREKLRSGEKFRLGVNKKLLSTSWWCFGDLDDDLEKKKFHSWLIDDARAETRPSDRFLGEGNWVLGENSQELGWLLDKKAESVVVEITD